MYLLSEESRLRFYYQSVNHLHEMVGFIILPLDIVFNSICIIPKQKLIYKTDSVANQKVLLFFIFKKYQFTGCPAPAATSL
jgi:hypothetical protein